MPQDKDISDKGYYDEDGPHYGDSDYADYGYNGYIEDTLDPTPWLLVGTTVFCFAAMLVAVPLMVRVHRKRQARLQLEEPSPGASASKGSDDSYVKMSEGQIFRLFNRKDSSKNQNQQQEDIELSARTILRFDKETRKILSRAIPFTISAVGSSAFSNTCLALVGHYIGTHALSAYALVELLVGLTDGILQGPISACSTLCAHAVGASNNDLAGQYIQLAVGLYLLSNIPLILVWWWGMEAVVLYLEWGDEDTARMSEDFVRVYIWSYLLGGISSGLWQLLEVTDHAKEGTVVSLAWGATNAIFIGILVTVKQNATLQHVGMIYNLTAFSFIAVTFAWAEYKQWLKPFRRGLFGSNAFRNWGAIRVLLKQALPLSVGYFFSNAEWTVLTFFASALGPAEVAAWAILGSIWELFYSCTSGIGDAAEIRAAYHFGENNPSMARLSSFKSLFLSMSVATVVSVVYVCLQNELPAWFTVDATLQMLLAELVPFVGVANLTMQFGMTSWSLIGAQGKYKLATWVSFISSWGATLPLAALFVYAFHLDLQGLTAAVVVGYVSTGAALSYVLLCTDWEKTTRKIQEENAAAASGNSTDDTLVDENDDVSETIYASMKQKSRAAKKAAQRGIRLLEIPPDRRPGIIVGQDVLDGGNTCVLAVRPFSYLWRVVHRGDYILSINGQDVTKTGAQEVAIMLRDARADWLTLVVKSPNLNFEDDDYDTDAED